MRLIFTTTGEEEVEHQMLGLSARAEHTEPLLKAIAGGLRAHVRHLFESDGEGDWPELAQSTIERKTENADRILVETEEMMDALTTEGGSHLEEILGDELIFGASGDAGMKAAVHQKGNASHNLPVRDPLIFNAEHRRSLTKIVQRYLIESDGPTTGPGTFGAATLDPFGLQ